MTPLLRLYIPVINTHHILSISTWATLNQWFMWYSKYSSSCHFLPSILEKPVCYSGLRWNTSCRITPSTISVMSTFRISSPLSGPIVLGKNAFLSYYRSSKKPEDDWINDIWYVWVSFTIYWCSQQRIYIYIYIKYFKI